MSPFTSDPTPTRGPCGQGFFRRAESGEALCSSCSAEEQVFREQMRRAFNFGVCLEVLFVEHVEDIFRGDYELSQSVS